MQIKIQWLFESASAAYNNQNKSKIIINEFTTVKQVIDECGFKNIYYWYCIKLKTLNLKNKLK